MKTQEKYKDMNDDELEKILLKEREAAALKIQIGFKKKNELKIERKAGIKIFSFVN